LIGKSARLSNALWKYLPPILSSILVIGISFRRLIFEPGFVIYRDLYPGQFYYPQLWSTFGSFLAIENYKFITFTGIFLPLRVFGTEIFEKSVYISAAFIAYLSFYFAAYLLLAYVKGWDELSVRRHIVCGLGAITFLLNPAAANIYFDFSLFVGYAFSPLIVAIFIKILDGRSRIDRSILLVAVLWWVSAIKAHFIVFGGLLLIPPYVVWVIYFGFSNRRLWVKNTLAFLTIIGLYLLLSSYWLIPFLQASQERFVGSYAPMTYESVAYLSYAPWYDVVRLLGSFQAWPYVSFPPLGGWLTPLWELASWILPVLMVYGAAKHRRHWVTWVLILFTLLGFLFACGTSPPFSGLYQWLVFGPLTPGLFRWLFRVASKWNVFLSLGACGLFSLALAEIYNHIQGRLEYRKLPKITISAVPLGYLIAFTLFAWPSFSGDFNGALDPQQLPNEFTLANRWLEQQADDFKVNWMPVTNGRELSWNQRPSGDLYTSMSSRPSIATNWNRHPVLYYSYVYENVANGLLDNLGEMISILNTRFVAYHDDVVSTHIHEDVEPVSVLIESGEEDLLEKIAIQKDLRKSWEVASISIYESADYEKQLFVPNGRYLVASDMNMINSISTLDDIALGDVGLYFDASRDRATFSIDWDGIILGADALNNMMISGLPVEEMYSPAEFTNHSIVTENWSRFDIYQFNWQSVLREHKIFQWDFDYGKLMVAKTTLDGESDKPRRITIPINISLDGDYHILARYLRHPDAGTLSTFVDNGLLSEVSGRDFVTGFRWVDLGNVQLTAGNHEISLENHSGFAAINSIVVLEKNKLDELRFQVEEQFASTPALYFLEIENDFDHGDALPSRETTALSLGRGLEINEAVVISTTLSLVSESEYYIALRASIPDTSVPITLTLNQEEIALAPIFGNEELHWIKTGQFKLPAGDLLVTITSAGPAVVDAIAIMHGTQAQTPEAFFSGESTPAEIEFERIDSTRYIVNVVAQRPFTLAFSETYDPLWLATGPGFSSPSAPLYGVINGFDIPRSGSYQILVEYQAQQGARLGAIISAVIVVALGPVIWLFQRQRSQGKDSEE